MLRFAAEKERRTVPRYEDKLSIIIQDKDPSPGEEVFSFDHCATIGSPLRHVAVVSIPRLNRSSHELQWGMYCLACRGFWFKVWAQYSVETLREHYQTIHPEKFRKIQDGTPVYTGPRRPHLGY